MGANRTVNFPAILACATILCISLGGASALAGSFSINIGHGGGHGHSGYHGRGGHYGYRGYLGHGRHFGHKRFGRSRGYYKPRYRRYSYRPYSYRYLGPNYYRRGGYNNYPYRYNPGYGATRFGRGYGSVYNIKVPVGSINAPVVVNNRNRGWQLLAAGRCKDARFYFGDQARLNPTDAVPKLGYALAAAVSGDFVRAEWAMRRAFKVDPASLHYVEFDEPVKLDMDQLVVTYQSRMDASGTNAGDAFMLAALNFLGHDHRPASDYIDLAIDAGDTSASAANLKKQLLAIADVN